ncbi:hypothetical protein Q1695_000472 [Nippostrongylus brasiliensis]|nr:hypothetical protein Q1695_000472 [Nippostrongylus brasiliensis]
MSSFFSSLWVCHHEGGGTQVQDRRYYSSERWRASAGFELFDTFLGTLLADRSSDIYHYFAVLLESDQEQQLQKDSEGAFFLDRDPEHFRTQLNALRYLAQIQAGSQNGTIKSGSSEEDLRSGKECKGIWHRIRGK